MGVIINRIKLVGFKGEKKVDALYDTGARLSFISKSMASKLSNVERLPSPLSFEKAKEGEEVTVNEAIRLDFYIEGIRLSDEFFIADELSEDVIIGAKTMQAWRLKLDFEQDRVLVDQMVTRLMLKKSTNLPAQ